eukprot:7313650-Alexandrium_andersonii.AAC.1
MRTGDASAIRDPLKARQDRKPPQCAISTAEHAHALGSSVRSLNCADPRTTPPLVPESPRW